MTTVVDTHRSDFDVGFEIDLGLPREADILWRDQAGHDVVWLMNNNALRTVATLPAVSPDWHVKAAAEFDAGIVGGSDILWQNDNGALVLWQMSDTAVNVVHALPNPGPSWHVVGDN